MHDEATFKILDTLAKHAVASKFFPTLGGYSGIFTIMLYAKELGIPPMQALFGGMRSIQGKIEVAPTQMHSMIRQAGHTIEFVEHTDLICTLKGIRKDNGNHATCSFSIEDAKAAGIYKAGGQWTKYARDMTFVRAISRLGRRLFPDVIGAMYVTGEISGKEVPEDTIELEEIPLEVEEEKPFTLEEGCSIISEFVKVTNDEALLTYLSGIKSKSTMSLKEIVNSCVENKERFITTFEGWKAKRL